MKSGTADQSFVLPLSLYNILEAFLAGTSDSFLVLDNNRKVILFNENFNEFIYCATGKKVDKSLSFDSFINEFEQLSVLSEALEKTYAAGETYKFSFTVSCGTSRWYDAEFHPLKQDSLVVGVGIGLFETTQKREAAEAVRKSEALFKALVQNCSDVFLLTNNLFRVIYVSDAFRQILGYEAVSLIGKTVFGMIHPEDQEPIAAWLAQLMGKNSSLGPIVFRAKHFSGNWIYLEATGQNMLQDKHVAALVFTLRDIQAIKVADQALINAEQRLTLLLNNTKESFIILDDTFSITAYNKAAQENAPFFFKSELQSGVSLLNMVDVSETETYIATLEKVTEGKEGVIDTAFTGNDGNLHIYQHTFRRLNNGAGHGIFITSSNITERRLAEIALKENEEKFKTLIEYSFDAILIIDAQARIEYASPSITHLLGYEPGELVGRNGFDFVYEPDAATLRLKLHWLINGGEETFADYRSATKNGGLKWLEAKGKNMFDNRHIRGILVSLRDITERKRMMEEQTKLTEELLKKNKDLQQFSFITSHNLRAPVANLISLLSLYNHNNAADPFNIELLQKFHECVNKLNETLNDLIDVLVIRSKLNTDTAFVKFNDVLSRVHQHVQALLNERDGTIECDFSAAQGVEYNKVDLESIFLNLVSNSLKYHSPDRALRIEVRSDQVENGVQVSFTDNGIGIDLDRYGDRIFGLYQRFHSSKEGKGLGLYMIKSQVTSSGGNITVRSQPGKGSTFTVTFSQ